MNYFFNPPALAAFIIVVLSTSSLCFAWPGKVVSVSDGDTLKVLHDGKEEKIRLYGIDTPENGQASGLKAKDLTNALVVGRNVEVESKYVDRYGRTVGLVRVDGILLNEMIIRNGYAWVYHQYCDEKFCSDWIKIEGEARRHKKGMWSEENILPPWEWREQSREEASGDKPPEIIIDPNEKAAASIKLQPDASDRNMTPPDTSSNGETSEDKPPEIIVGPSVTAASVEFQAAASDRNKASRDALSNEVSKNYSRFKCDGRTYCSQMTSCEEATFFIKNCKGTKMDGDNDGVPCEQQWCWR